MTCSRWSAISKPILSFCRAACRHVSNMSRGRRCARDSKCSTRSEEHTSELQSLMRISYAVFCLKKKNKQSGTADSTCMTVVTDKKDLTRVPVFTTHTYTTPL